MSVGHLGPDAGTVSSRTGVAPTHTTSYRWHPTLVGSHAATRGVLTKEHAQVRLDLPHNDFTRVFTQRLLGGKLTDCGCATQAGSSSLSDLERENEIQVPVGSNRSIFDPTLALLLRWFRDPK